MSLLDALLLEGHPLDVHVAYRQDGIKGSGSISDPWDGSTDARFDAVMASLPANVPVRVHLQFDTGTVEFVFSGSEREVS